MTAVPAVAPAAGGPAGRRRRHRSGAWLPVVVLGGLVAAGCSSPATWRCENHGSGRRCARPLPTPPGAGWDCWVAGGDLACGRPDWGPQVPGWTCASAGAATVCRAPGAALPSEPAPDGWQGHVADGWLVARWRRADNAPWRCGGTSCVERRPDRPSADEWECVEGDGRVLCRGRYGRGLDPRWRCAMQGEHVLCADLDPDHPAPEDPSAWHCAYDDSTKLGRFCSAEDRPVGPCPGPTAAGRCWPYDPAPRCWFDDGCPAGRSCRVGECVLR